MVDSVRVRIGRIVMLAGIMIGSIAGFSVPTRADWYPPETVWVESTGHTVDGLFLDAWRNARALLGDPISEERTEFVQLPDENEPVDRTVQYFDGGALLYREELSSVTMMPLGIWALSADLERFPAMPLPDAADCGDLPETECAVFDTGYSVRAGFKAFWDSNEGEALIGAPQSEQFTNRDHLLTQYFANAVLQWDGDGAITTRSLGREMAERQQVDLAAIPQPEEIPVFQEELFIAPLAPDLGVTGDQLSDYGPGPIAGTEREIVISRGMQTLWAYEGGELVLTTLVSTGVGNVPETVTPLGNWAIHTKLESQTMEGVIAGEHYRVEDVPWVMYFDDRGDALHGTYWHNNFGVPMSHGCVNLPLDVAEYLYSWADYGTPVTIIE
jgi:hypothetical protein